MRTDILIEHID